MKKPSVQFQDCSEIEIILKIEIDAAEVYLENKQLRHVVERKRNLLLQTLYREYAILELDRNDFLKYKLVISYYYKASQMTHDLYCQPSNL